jgi:hypothetical protein
MPINLSEVKWDDDPIDPSAVKWDDAPKSPKKPTNPPVDQGPIPALVGAGEAAMASMYSLPASIWGGLRGVGDIVSGQGLDQAARTQEAVTKNNFGFGEYKPSTEKGKKYTEKVGEAFQYPIEKVGDSTALIGKALGNEALGRTIGEASAETLMNFLPIPVAKAYKGMKGSKSKGRVTPEPSGGKGEALRKEVEKAKAPVAPQEPVQGDLFIGDKGPINPFSAQSQAELKARETGQRDLFGPTNEPLPKVIPETTFDPDAYLNSTQTDLFVDGGNLPDGQLDLFNQGQSVGSTGMGPEPIPRPLDTTAQGELFDQSTGGRVANPYEAATGDWRVDENGIPVKVDLSLEAQQMGQPLQRNIWGDELEPTMSPVGQGLQGVEDMSSQMGRPLTDAIDSMPWAQRRGAINSQLKGDIPASGALKGAMLEANTTGSGTGRGNFSSPGGTRRGGRNQRGHLNMDLFDPAFRRIKELDNGIRLLMRGTKKGPVILAIDKQGQHVGEIQFSQDAWAREPRPHDNLEAGWVTTDPNKVSSSPVENRLKETQKSKYPGLATDMYRFASEEGDIIRSGAQTPEGKGLWDRFEEKGISQDGMIPWDKPDTAVTGQRPFPERSGFVPQSQRGAIDIGNATEPKPGNEVSSLTKDSPEVVAAAAKQAADRRRNAAAKIVGLEGYDADINTPADVIAALQDGKVKDIPFTQAVGANQLGLTPGVNTLAIKTNNPLLKYVRKQYQNVVLDVGNLVRKHITGPDGFAKVLQGLSQQERNEFVQAWRIGDETKTFLTPEQLRAAGYNEKVIAAVQKGYEIDKIKLDIWNEERAKVGMPPVESRPGHMPGIFKGDYKQIVFGKNPDGSRKVVSIIAVDHRWQLKAARDKILEEFPDATFTDYDRKALGGNGQKSDIFNGVNDLLQVLARESPEFAKIQELYQAGIKEQADAMYGASLHSLAKKGVSGNEGNKPWLNVDQNTNAYIKSYLNYWEEGIMSHKNMPVEAEIKALMDNPALDNQPRAKNFVNQYMRNATGRNLGTLGDALNKTLDWAPSKVGLGSGATREFVNQLNKRGGQQVMGFFNYMHTALQFIQVPQMAFPEAMTVAKKIGSPVDEVLTSMRDALPLGIRLATEKTTGKKLLSAEDRAVVDAAEKRGLLTFSEFQEMSAVTQSKFSKGYDTLVDFNRTLAEKGTRPLVYFGVVDMLKKRGYTGERLYDAAYNITQAAMVDYHMNERPQVYKRLGVVGQMASSLATFKHANLNMYTRQYAEAKKGNWKPLAYSVIMANTVFAGITGTPFYQEVDQAVQAISDAYFGGPKTIKELLLKNLPDFVKIGALSSASNINVQSRMSAADVLPNSPIEAVSPYAKVASDMIGAGWELATKQDSLAAKNFAVAMSPSGPIKGLVKDALKTDAQGNPIDKYGMKGDPRNEWDRKLAKYGVGLSVDEAKRNENSYINNLRQTANRKAQADITDNLKRKYVQGILTEEDTKKAIADYVARKGDHQQLINSLVQYAKTTPLTRQQRAQGIPGKTLSSLYQYQNAQQEQ